LDRPDLRQPHLDRSFQSKPEHSPVGTMVGVLTSVDPDAGDDNAAFLIDGGTVSETEFTGGLEELNALLDGLIFTPETDFVGDAFLDILTNDLGHNGLGGSQTASDRIAISVQ
jgi:hypothetical protein